MTIDESLALDSIVSFLYNEQKQKVKLFDFDIILNHLNLNIELSEFFLIELESRKFLDSFRIEESIYPKVKLSSTGIAFVSSSQSFKKFGVSLTRELVKSIDSILTECREIGFISVTKETSDIDRKAINESEARGWIQKRNSYSYDLSSEGIKVLDYGSVENYLMETKNNPTITNNISNQPTINAENVVFGDNHGTINQSSSNSNLNSSTIETINKSKPKKPPIKSVIDIIKIIGIIIGILSGLIAIYKFWIE